MLDFHANLTKGMGDPMSPDFQKVFLRGHHFDFSPSIINLFLQCPDLMGP